MKKNFKGALICLMMVALMGLFQVGVASAATTAGSYYGNVTDDATGAQGTIFFTVVNSRLQGVVIAPDNITPLDNGGGTAKFTGSINGSGVIAGSAKVPGATVTFAGVTGDPDPVTGLYDFTGTYVLADGTTGTWDAQQLNPLTLGHAGAYFGTFEISARFNGGKAVTGVMSLIVDNAGNVTATAQPAKAFGSEPFIAAGVPTSLKSVFKFVGGLNIDNLSIDGAITVDKVYGKIYATDPTVPVTVQIGTYKAYRY